MEKKAALPQVATQDSTLILISANRIFVTVRMVSLRLVSTVWIIEKKTALQQVATQDSTTFLISANRIYVPVRMVYLKLV